jgi:hypothetical protein
MRELNPQGLEALSVEDAIAYLKTNPADIILESAAFLPEADVLCCRYREKRFNIKFDLDYGVWIEPIDALSGEALEDIANRLKQLPRK